MLSLKRPLTTRDKAQVGFFLLHMGGMAWILLSPSPQPAATATTASSPPSRAFSWLAALALAVAAGAGLGAACLRALLYQPSTRRALIRRAPFLSAGAQAALALLLPASALMFQTDDDVASVYFVLAVALDPELHQARTLLGLSRHRASADARALQWALAQLGAAAAGANGAGR